MNIISSLYQEIIADDGDILTFLLHKVVHVFTGAIIALFALHFGLSFLLAFVAALLIGISRELAKTTGMLLHALTAVITACGAFVAYALVGNLGLEGQIISAVIMAVYNILITVLQLNNGNL